MSSKKSYADATIVKEKVSTAFAEISFVYDKFGIPDLDRAHIDYNALCRKVVLGRTEFFPFRQG